MQASDKRHGISVRRALDAVAVGPGKLDPGAIADKGLQSLKTRIGQTARNREVAPMVDHKGHRQPGQTGSKRGKVLCIDQELEVPAQLTGHCPVGFQFAKADAPTIQHVQSQPNDAALFQARQFRGVDIRRHYRDATQPSRVCSERAQQQPVVGTVHADLNQYTIAHPCTVEHCQIGVSWSLRWRVAALIHKGKLRRQPDHMGMRIHRPSRNAIAHRPVCRPGRTRTGAGCGWRAFLTRRHGELFRVFPAA